MRQQEDVDFRVEPGALVFDRALAREGRLGPIRWLSIFLGIAGTYRKNDAVDVVYESGGRRTTGNSARLVGSAFDRCAWRPGAGSREIEARAWANDR